MVLLADERRVAVSRPSTARTRAAGTAVPAGAPDTGPSPAGTDPTGGEPSGTDPPDPACLPRTAPFSYPSDGDIDLAQARALIRTQLRTALTTGAAVLIVVTGLPLLLAVTPALGRLRAQGVPVAWLVLTLGVQPLWAGASVLHLRRAERAERDLTRPAGRS